MINLSNYKSVKKSKSKLWLIILSGMLVYFCWLYMKGSADYKALKQEEQIYNEKIASAKERKKELAEKEKEAESDETIENLARNELNYLKPNEILFIDGEKAN